MGEVKLVITPDADDDIREIYNYLSEYSVNAALTQVDRLMEFFELCANFHD